MARFPRCFALSHSRPCAWRRERTAVKAGLTAGSSRSAFAERMLRRRLLIWPPVLDAANSAPAAALNETPMVISIPPWPTQAHNMLQAASGTTVCYEPVAERSCSCESPRLGVLLKGSLIAKTGCYGPRAKVLHLCQERETLWYSGRSASSLMAVCVRASTRLKPGSWKHLLTLNPCHSRLIRLGLQAHHGRPLTGVRNPHSRRQQTGQPCEGEL